MRQVPPFAAAGTCAAQRGMLTRGRLRQIILMYDEKRLALLHLLYYIIDVGSISNRRNEMTLQQNKRRWIVRQGSARANVAAQNYEQARERAAQIGFGNPDAIVLDEALARAPPKWGLPAAGQILKL